ncbi:MAG: HAMP domain-containing histidine kinase [Pseudomonadota bacterium]|nr:MAG: HAMP domain-containing histidine kinase [Pseudomonadota bacterium]
MRTVLTGWSKQRLRLWLALFFLALAVPTGILVRQAYSQLKWEAFHQHRLLAEKLAARIDSRLVELTSAEEARSFADYGFLVVAGDPSANFLQRSPLSNYPVAAAIPGVIGYFQVDAAGAFSTPLVPLPGTAPDALGLAAGELAQRVALQDDIRRILSENRLVEAPRADVAGRRLAAAAASARSPEYERSYTSGAIVEEEVAQTRERDETAAVMSSNTQPADQLQEQVPAQAAFDRLKQVAPPEQKKKQELSNKLGRIEDIDLDDRYQVAPKADAERQAMLESPSLLEKRAARKERTALPEPQSPDVGEARAAKTDQPAALRIRTFESEIDPFEFSMLDSGHFVLFRKVWRDGQRYIQGTLIEQKPFLQGVVESAFRETALSQMSNLIIAYQGDVISAISGLASRGYPPSTEELSGALLYQTRLSAPLSDLEMIFSVTRLPAGPGAPVITWVALVMLAVLCGGFYLMYRLGARQIELGRQQQDFVSAVSHELKTPLTSIRMYSEMLREGWADDGKKKSYYDYIHDESERLSRLIANVLQLARMTRNDIQVDAKALSVSELTDSVRSSVSSHIERAGFELRMDCNDAATAVMRVDPDLFTQIVINLVDNAIKFSAKSQTLVIDIACRRHTDASVVFSVRDYGPGIDKDKMKKIFRLFYRPENELTRETVGTGIGLALVHQLALAMNAKVDVVNCDPGAEFRVTFPTVEAGA